MPVFPLLPLAAALADWSCPAGTSEMARFAYNRTLAPCAGDFLVPRLPVVH